ncbi:RagB/SusD family nutrient uptake outer membrane protein [uncultured Bacteroides sp.]|uniref:RagB/SusD family nutrient uptake outer membrane protein n=1 Tax=uncultured Bacteroides sp. TaxID=162156 RepID=UPI002AA954AD|nr:RagB/SusD family nutrient uptake outer membrane protein [uncultured Bacteroides sp.]
MKFNIGKKAHVYAVLLLSVFLAAGCNDFLNEVEPQGQESSTVFMQNQNNAELAIIGLYNLLTFGSGNGPDGDWVDNHFDCYFGSMMSDDSEKGSQPSDNPNGLTQLTMYQLTPSLLLNKFFYIHGFWGVSRANFILDNVTNANFDENIKKRMLGEAHFFRAYYYYYLLQHYGGMPIFRSSVTASDFGSVPRASYTETMQFIIDEFKEAEQLLPNKEDYGPSDAGRASKGAARGMMARAMLYRLGTDPECSDTWQDLYDLTNTIISSGSYQLMPNYATLFEEITDGNYREESLFEYTGKDGWMNSGLVLPWYFEGNRGVGAGWGFNQPTQDLVDAFDKTDPRLSCTVYGIGYNNGILYGSPSPFPDRSGQMMTNYYNRKAATYPGASGMDALLNGTSKAVFVIRYADVLLMHAEAAYYLNKESEARQMVNMVRTRARNSSYSQGFMVGDPRTFTMPAATPNVPDIDESITGQALLEAIWHERRLELGMENIRTYDLIRTDRLFDRVSKVKDQYRTGGAGPVNTHNGADMEIRIGGIGSNIQNYCLKVNIPGVGGGERYLPLLAIPDTEITYWNIEPNQNN